MQDTQVEGFGLGEIGPMSESGLGRVKTKSDLVVMPSGRQIFAFFFPLRVTIEPKIPGAVIPRRVFYTARGQNRKSRLVLMGSALPPKPDIGSRIYEYTA